jgi:Rieske Fe-S protein
MHAESFRIARRQTIVGAGLALAVTVLAACTTYGKKPAEKSTTTGAAPASGAPPSSAGPGSPAAPGTAIAQTSDVPVGSGVIIADDDIVVTQPSAGVFNGLSATCTHAGCKVSEVVDGTINCLCHGSKFNLDGSVANGPAKRPLEAKPVSVEGDSIFLG